ncbi:MAG: metallophosphoesterase family protein [Bryobacterales bacterium]|nr:metallophosphoesterase family protein [Bryobacterales bacterium]
MRIAIVSDIHGNLAALEAVRADLRDASPDLVLHGGDLADSGPHPAEVVDCIRALGWPGVMGNTDEMLFRPEALEAFAATSRAPASVWATVRENAAAARAELGAERLAWMAGLPRVMVREELALVHAGPADLWRAPDAKAADEELVAVYGALGAAVVVYGHIHVPFVRSMDGLMVANAGSVGLPFDGDPRASYLLVEDGRAVIRRVEQ